MFTYPGTITWQRLHYLCVPVLTNLEVKENEFISFLWIRCIVLFMRNPLLLNFSSPPWLNAVTKVIMPFLFLFDNYNSITPVRFAYSHELSWIIEAQVRL